MTTIKRTALALVAILGIAAGLSTLVVSPILHAQTALTATTLTAAVGVTDRTIAVTSATNFAANSVVVVDGEAMTVQTSYVSGLVIPVTRGRSGTAVVAHASGTAATVGLPSYFSSSPPPAGPCTSTAEVALPRFVIAPTVGASVGIGVYNCAGATSTTQTWQRYSQDGYPAFPQPLASGRANVPPVYTTSTAIVVQPGVTYVGSGGALAMTLVNPTLLQNGMVMMIVASTAQAHTVTYTAGFGGGTTARDVATFGGAINDALIIYADNLVWWVWSTRNVTLG